MPCYANTYLSSPPCSWARGHSCLGLRTGVSPHFSTNSMRAMVAAQCQCVIGSEQVRFLGDAAERPAGPLRPPAGSWRAPRPPPYSRAMPVPRASARAECLRAGSAPAAHSPRRAAEPPARIPRYCGTPGAGQGRALAAACAIPPPIRPPERAITPPLDYLPLIN